MSIQRAFAPYEGEQPYIFISYAHADAASVLPIAATLHSRGYRIWYDEGIEAGSEWPESIAVHLSRAALVLCFISEAYVRSDNCRREMHFALTKRIKTLHVFLERTALTPGLEMQIGNSFALMKFEMDEALFYDKLLSAPLLDASLQGEPPALGKAAAPRPKASPQPARRRRRLSRKITVLAVCGVLLAAIVTLAIVGRATGLTARILTRVRTPALQTLSGDTIVRFREPAFEQAARTYTGLDSGELRVSDLAGIMELCLCGDEVFFSEQEEAQPDSTGTLRDLSDLRYFTGLRKLSLRSQSLTNLETMPPIPLEELSVSGGRLNSLSGVGRLTALRRLSTDGCPVTSLGDISQCIELRELSLAGSYLSDLSPLKPLLHLTGVRLSNVGLDKLDPVLDHGALRELSLDHCDLRGRFFKAFDAESRLSVLSLTDCELSGTDNLEDFSSLCELTLIRSGSALDWSALSELPMLNRVTADESMRDAMERAGIQAEYDEGER